MIKKFVYSLVLGSCLCSSVSGMMLRLVRDAGRPSVEQPSSLHQQKSKQSNFEQTRRFINSRGLTKNEEENNRRSLTKNRALKNKVKSQELKNEESYWYDVEFSFEKIGNKDEGDCFLIVRAIMHVAKKLNDFENYEGGSTNGFNAKLFMLRELYKKCCSNGNKLEKEDVLLLKSIMDEDEEDKKGCNIL